MAKQNKVEVKDEKVEDKKSQVKPQLITKRNSRVQEAPKESFSDRTKTVQPWLDEKGKQVNK